MANPFDTVRGYVEQYAGQLALTVVYEDAEEKILVVEAPEQGIHHLILDCEDDILVIEQFITTLPGADAATYRSLLQINRDIVHGALCLDESGKRLIFRDTLALEHLDFNELEDPVKMSEQAIRDLKSQLDASLQGLAEVKAIAIRTRREFGTHSAEAADYKTKAMRLLQKAERGELDPGEADRLATQALEQQSRAQGEAAKAKANKEKYDQLCANLEHKIGDLRDQIRQWENEMKTLKARARVSIATRKINKQMAQIDSSSTIATLERMRNKVEEEEALAESYGDMAVPTRGLDSEIDAALNTSGSDALAMLKAEMKQKTA